MDTTELSASKNKTTTHNPIELSILQKLRQYVSHKIDTNLNNTNAKDLEINETICKELHTKLKGTKKIKLFPAEQRSDPTNFAKVYRDLAIIKKKYLVQDTLPEDITFRRMYTDIDCKVLPAIVYDFNTKNWEISRKKSTVNKELVDIKIILAKNMSQYVCIGRYEFNDEDINLLSEKEENKSIDRLDRL